MIEIVGHLRIIYDNYQNLMQYTRFKRILNYLSFGKENLFIFIDVYFYFLRELLELSLVIYNLGDYFLFWRIYL